jgi:hypothetical protein
MKLRFFSAFTKVASGIAFLVIIPMASVEAGSASSSSASAITARFTSEGISTGIGPIGFLRNSAPPAYDKTVSIHNTSKSVAITPTYPTPTLFVSATGIKSHVASNGIQVDFVSAEGDSTLDSANLSLNLYPLPPKGSLMPIPEPFLTLSVTKVSSTSSFNHVFPQFITPSGSTSIGSLVLSGSLINTNQPLEFKGNPDANFILFESPTVTVTLNKQTVAELISCQVGQAGGCNITPYNITTNAIHINLHNAEIEGHRVSGDISIGSSYAD